MTTQTVATPVARGSAVPSSRRLSSSSHPSAPSGAGGRFLPGELVGGRYRIVALLGTGGMGEVYRADDLTLGQQVALKFLPESLMQSADALNRLRGEVRLARQVSHPNVCRVYDAGEAHGYYFLSMEYVDGENLSSLLRRIGRIPADKAIEIARQLCAGLAAAHAKGVLHRDLKPANVMLDSRGQALLTDFGLAGLAGEFEGAEIRSGTPAYMSPEQLAGKEVSVRSDLYSLGLVLYEIFTGKRPFETASLGELIRLRNDSVIVNPSSIVRDLDPAIERVILSCLQAEPALRPVSALAASAALPGGDALSAAIAAGETPSPQMVAAAGEGRGLAPPVAAGIFFATLATLAAGLVLASRWSALEIIRPEHPPDVLEQKSRELIDRLGYSGAPADAASGFYWDQEYAGYVRNNDKPQPLWPAVISTPPSLLRFWYRQSPAPLFGQMIHDDLMTPGIVTERDPPPIESGMTHIVLDPKARLLYFTRIPPQFQDSARNPPPKESPPVDWKVLFAAAGLDPANFQPTEPQWTWLAAADTRVAWTGAWPISKRPLRIEAAAWQGKPVAFSLIGPWTGPDRMPSAGSSGRENAFLLVLGVLFIVICAGAAWVARRNLLQGRGDRQGAFRLAAGIFCVLMALWLHRTHLAPDLAMLGSLILAVCNSLFYAAVLWAVYIALEPYLRRRWPQTLISWSAALTGRLHDPIVGRDVLLGSAAGIVWVFVPEILELWLRSTGGPPDMSGAEVLLGVRAAIGACLAAFPHAIRDALIFFFLLSLLRVLLRNEWLAVGSFVLLFTTITVLQNEQILIAAIYGCFFYFTVSLVVLRLGLLSLTIGFFVNALLRALPATLAPSAWYFPSSALMITLVLWITAWGYRNATAGRPLFSRDLFD